MRVFFTLDSKLVQRLQKRKKKSKYHTSTLSETLKRFNAIPIKISMLFSMQLEGTKPKTHMNPQKYSSCQGSLKKRPKQGPFY